MDTPAPATEAEARAHVNAVVRGAGTSFYWAMRRLPERKRRAMFGIYAFCREVDDVVDEDGDIEAKRTQLGLWRGEIERLYGDRPRNPVTMALVGPVHDFGLGKEDFRAIIDGMEMDAETRVRIATMDELTRYCDRVACAVGRLSVRVFGLGEDDGRELAAALGQALQLTNILRDFAEDADRDRLYVPEDLLRAHGIDGNDLAEILSHPRFPEVCETIAAVAERRFAQAEEVIGRCDPAKVRPAVMMMQVYRRILARLARRGWLDLSRPVGLSSLGKAWLALRYGLLG